ncbi:hypothetical protein [Achromobacter piechaudii]|uniref:hypothetical protein n=1 Tax=Achromobacter piechaudii TaxID=72556 RepID=UPI0015838345|nr:hypothetical protein [Achromobacter piechaudii]
MLDPNRRCEAAMDKLLRHLLAAATFASGVAGTGMLVWAIFFYLTDAEVWRIPFVGSCLFFSLAAWAHSAYEDRAARVAVLQQNAKPYERNQQP